MFREDVDTYDTMAASVRYSNGSILNYTLNTFMPFEGFRIAFNGTEGRLEVRYSSHQPWEVERLYDIELTRAISEAVSVPVSTLVSSTVMPVSSVGICHKSSVSIITPVYNENPNVFLEALKSWDQNKPTEIISVIDYTDKQSWFRQFPRGIHRKRGGDDGCQRIYLFATRYHSH